MGREPSIPHGSRGHNPGRIPWSRFPCHVELKARHINLDPDVVEQTLSYMDSEAKSVKASMQTDLENGRPLELEALNGAVVRLGREVGVPTPANETIYGLLKVHDRE